MIRRVLLALICVVPSSSTIAAGIYTNPDGSQSRGVVLELGGRPVTWNNPLSLADSQNAPYGQSGAQQGATLTPGNTTPVTPARNIHIFCAPTTSPATGYTTLTEANGETHQVQLATGGQYDFPWAVTLVAAQTTGTGTLAACEFKNMN